MDTAVERVAAPAVTEVTPAQLLMMAVQSGADMERMQQLMGLQERWDANVARKAYVAAMAAFKAEPIKILKTKQVDIPGGAKFAHATLADVVDGAVRAMSKHGLSHGWNVQQDGPLITVTCVVTHALGHSEKTTMAAAPDDSGKKNRIQQIASTVTYLERYTLMAACGLAAKDMDDDARSAEKPKEPTITDQQVADLMALITEHGGNLFKLLRYLKVDSLDQIIAKNYAWVCGEVKRLAAARAEAPK